MLRLFLEQRDYYRLSNPDWFPPLVNARALGDVRATYPAEDEALRLVYVRWVHRHYTFSNDQGRA